MEMDSKAFKRNERALARLAAAANDVMDSAEIIAERGPPAGYRVRKGAISKLEAALTALSN